MTLFEYLMETGETHQQLADRIGDCSLGGLRKWLRGDRIPQKDQMARIVAATGGKVMPNDFYGYSSAGVESRFVNAASCFRQASESLRSTSMVAPSPILNGLVTPHSSSFGSSLNSSSVAGMRGSNGPFWKLGTTFRELGIRFRQSKAGRRQHV